MMMAEHAQVNYHRNGYGTVYQYAADTFLHFSNLIRHAKMIK